MSRALRKPIPAGITSDEMRAIDRAARNLMGAADAMLTDLCEKFEQPRNELSGTPLALDLAINRMREVLL